ncbi:MAG: hypothetical protein ABSB82_20275 [Terriglobia bacterium]|jgi:hypothetical protein
MKAKPRSQPGDLRPEYHFDYSTAVRGKYYRRILTEGANVLETLECASRGAQGHRLSPEELGLLAKKLASAKSPEEAARLRESITLGFYGI